MAAAVLFAVLPTRHRAAVWLLGVPVSANAAKAPVSGLSISPRSRPPHASRWHSGGVGTRRRQSAAPLVFVIYGVTVAGIGASWIRVWHPERVLNLLAVALMASRPARFVGGCHPAFQRAVCTNLLASGGMHLRRSVGTGRLRNRCGIPPAASPVAGAVLPAAASHAHRFGNFLTISITIWGIDW